MVTRIVTSGECHVTSRVWRVIFFLSLLTSPSSLILGQQPQAQGGQPIYPVNAKYVQGVGPGFWPTAGAGLNLNLSAGTAYCGAPPALVSYAGGSLTLTASATNYVYLDPSADCSPAFNTTGFKPGQIPLAQITTGTSSVTSVTDARNWFAPLPCAMSSSGAATCSALGTNQDLTLTPSGTGKVEIATAGTTAQELTAADDGTHWLQMLNLYTTGGSPTFPLTVPVISFQDKTNSIYFGDMEGDNRGGMILYGQGHLTLQADDELDVQAGVGGATKDIVLTPGGTGSVLVPKLNNIRFADQFPGADAGAKIAACIADLPSTGGTCDARGLEGAQTISATVTITTANVKILFGAATYTISASPGFDIRSNDVTLEGLSNVDQIIDPGGTGATILNYTGSGNVLRFGDGTNPYMRPVVKNIQILYPSAASQAILINDYVQGGILENVGLRGTGYSGSIGVQLGSTDNGSAFTWKLNNCVVRKFGTGVYLRGNVTDETTFLGGWYTENNTAILIGNTAGAANGPVSVRMIGVEFGSNANLAVDVVTAKKLTIDACHFEVGLSAPAGRLLLRIGASAGKSPASVTVRDSYWNASGADYAVEIDRAGYVAFDGNYAVGNSLLAFVNNVATSVDFIQWGRNQMDFTAQNATNLRTGFYSTASVIGSSAALTAGSARYSGLIQTIRQASGSIAAGTEVNRTTPTWPIAWPDVNYSVTCTMVNSSTTTDGLRIHHISSKSTTNVGVVIKNDDTVNAQSGTIECVGVHD